MEITFRDVLVIVLLLFLFIGEPDVFDKLRELIMNIK